MAFFIAGGFPMVVVVVFGLVALGSAAHFAWSPVPGRVGHIAALCLSVLAASVAGVLACLMAVATNVTGNPEWASSPELHLILVAGVGESMTPGILGFAMVSAVALVTSVGLRRLPAEA